MFAIKKKICAPVPISPPNGVGFQKPLACCTENGQRGAVGLFMRRTVWYFFQNRYHKFAPHTFWLGQFSLEVNLAQ